MPEKGDMVLKPEQSRALELVFQGKDVFIWFPTGFGKSVCYQAVPFMFDFKLGRNYVSNPVDRSVVIVVSPLVSLMVDQVNNLRSTGVGAAILSGGQFDKHEELLASERDIEQGKFSLLFGAPESIVGVERWRQLLIGEPLCHQIVAVAIDEAHCVYKWYLVYVMLSMASCVFDCLHYVFTYTCIHVQESQI